MSFFVYWSKIVHKSGQLPTFFVYTLCHTVKAINTTKISIVPSDLSDLSTPNDLNNSNNHYLLSLFSLLIRAIFSLKPPLFTKSSDNRCS